MGRLLASWAVVFWLGAASALAAERTLVRDEARETMPPRFALLIGADDYTMGWPRKQNAVRDAKLIASEFLRHGYKVALLANPDSRRLARALKQFFLVDGDDPRAQLFVWYSGHAHTIGTRTFLVPTDAPLPRREADFINSAFALDDYVELLRRAPASQVYTVLDAPVAAIEFDTRTDANAAADPFAVDLPVRQFLVSAAVGQAPADDGVFRRMFLRGLAGINRADGNLDKMLTADEIGAYMVNRIAALTKNRQTPLYGKLPGREFAGGDFAFRIGTSHRTDMVAARARDPNGDAEEIEQVLWSSIQDSTDPRKFESFLKIYPDGAHAEKAYARLQLVRRAQDSTVAALSTPDAPLLGAPVPLAATEPDAPAQRPQFAPPQPQPRQANRGAPPAPAPPAMPVPRVTAAPLQQVAQTIRQPAFEEMAVPVPSGREPASAPLALTPRNLNRAAPPSGIPTTFRVAPRRTQPQAVIPAPAPAAATPASLPVIPPKAKAAPEASAAPLVGRIVQLGAFRSRSEAEKALRNWRSAVPALFQRVAEPAIVTADLGEKGIFHRVRVPGFADSRKASEFCGEYKGAGRDCYVVP
jgi:hypothetical protein